MNEAVLNQEKRRTVLAQLAALKRMDVRALNEQWRTLMGTEPPDCRPSVLQRRLALRVQELVWGSSSEDGKHRIENRRVELGLNDAALIQGRAGKARRDDPVVGTRLAREWNGARHEVTVTADGFEYKGRRYKSLSAIAKSITGTHWNGRAFFGLYRQKRK